VHPWGRGERESLHPRRPVQQHRPRSHPNAHCWRCAEVWARRSRQSRAAESRGRKPAPSTCTSSNGSSCLGARYGDGCRVGLPGANGWRRRSSPSPARCRHHRQGGWRTERLRPHDRGAVLQREPAGCRCTHVLRGTERSARPHSGRAPLRHSGWPGVEGEQRGRPPVQPMGTRNSCSYDNEKDESRAGHRCSSAVNADGHTLKIAGARSLLFPLKLSSGAQSPTSAWGKTWVAAPFRWMSRLAGGIHRRFLGQKPSSVVFFSSRCTPQYPPMCQHMGSSALLQHGVGSERWCRGRRGKRFAAFSGRYRASKCNRFVELARWSRDTVRHELSTVRPKLLP